MVSYVVFLDIHVLAIHGYVLVNHRAERFFRFFFCYTDLLVYDILFCSTFITCEILAPQFIGTPSVIVHFRFIPVINVTNKISKFGSIHYYITERYCE